MKIYDTKKSAKDHLRKFMVTNFFPAYLIFYLFFFSSSVFTQKTEPVLKSVSILKRYHWRLPLKQKKLRKLMLAKKLFWFFHRYLCSRNAKILRIFHFAKVVASKVFARTTIKLVSSVKSTINEVVISGIIPSKGD